MLAAKVKDYIEPYLEMLDLEREKCSQISLEDLKKSCMLTFDSARYSEKLFCKILLRFTYSSSSCCIGLSVGAPVIISRDSLNSDFNRLAQRGLVYEVNTKFVEVSTSGLPNSQIISGGKNFFLIPEFKDMHFSRITTALKDLLKKAEIGMLSEVVLKLLKIDAAESKDVKSNKPTKDVSSIQLITDLFSDVVLSSHPNKIRMMKKFAFFNADLDHSQQLAVNHAISNERLTIIHGPPGTGKTNCLVEIIQQANANEFRTLVCAPSNGAIDTIIKKLEDLGFNDMIRLGPPARASHVGRRYTVDTALNKMLDKQIIRIQKLTENMNSPEHFTELRQCFQDLFSQRDIATQNLLKSKGVVFSTLVGASSLGQLSVVLNEPDFWFDLLIIDECSMAIEPACMIAIPLAEKCIFAGDHLQMPPVIFSTEAALKGLEVSLMDKCVQLFDTEIQLLDVQYRMNKNLMEWPSKKFYKKKLTAHRSVQFISIVEISNLIDFPSLMLIDTKGCDMGEFKIPNISSTASSYEASLIASLVTYFIHYGVQQNQIGIINPYSLQRYLLKEKLESEFSEVEIESVDGYQGREKEIIILSFFGSTPRKTVGFLANDQRINVAVTRARRHLCVICDSSTLNSYCTLYDLIQHIKLNGVVEDAESFGFKVRNFRNSQFISSQVNQR